MDLKQIIFGQRNGYADVNSNFTEIAGALGKPSADKVGIFGSNFIGTKSNPTAHTYKLSDKLGMVIIEEQVNVKTQIQPWTNTTIFSFFGLQMQYAGQISSTANDLGGAGKGTIAIGNPDFTLVTGYSAMKGPIFVSIAYLTYG